MVLEQENAQKFVFKGESARIPLGSLQGCPDLLARSKGLLFLLKGREREAYF